MLVYSLTMLTRAEIVIDYTYTCFFMNFRKYLRKNKKFSETIFASSYEAQVEFFDKKVTKIL